MKVLLLSPSFYTLHRTFVKGFTKLNYSVYHHDYRLYLHNWKQKLNVQIFRFPFSVRDKWDEYFFNGINNKHLEIFEREQPDIVFIYNNECLLPETLQYFKSQNVKLVFFLGDSPYFTPTNKYYMHLLFYADLVISPDSFWAEQLKLLGVKNVIVDFPGYDESLLEFRNPTGVEKEKYSIDVLFVGTGYVDTWGYKRALFASQFSRLNLQVYGTKHWQKWFIFFPELKPKFQLMSQRMSLEKLIILSKCAKIYPVDANPAILNGLHLRVFDCIASGVLPIVEYRKDLDTFFKKEPLPIIHDYSQAESLAKYYISHDAERQNKLARLRNYTWDNFRAFVVFRRVLNFLG